MLHKHWHESLKGLEDSIAKMLHTTGPSLAKPSEMCYNIASKTGAYEVIDTSEVEEGEAFSVYVDFTSSTLYLTCILRGEPERRGWTATLELLDPVSSFSALQALKVSFFTASGFSFCFWFRFFSHLCMRMSMSTFNCPGPDNLTLLLWLCESPTVVSTLARMNALSTTGFTVGVGVTLRLW